MAHYSSTAAIDLSFTGNLSQGELTRDSRHQSGPHRPLIHILDDYSLLNIFSFSRPEILDESKVDPLSLESDEWNCEWWWHRLVQVCRRWRYIVLESAIHLRLSLVCTRGSPVADMLAHSAPLPLVIDCLFNYNEITAEDEEGISLALQHRDRVRRIRLRGSAPILKKLINSLNGDFPILEYLFIEPKWIRGSFSDDGDFHESFRAPHLRHLFLARFDIPIGFPLLTTTTSLVTLYLGSIPRSAYFDSNFLFQRISLMPLLEILGIYFDDFLPSQLLLTPIVTRVTLPNLRRFDFVGDSGYLEALLPRVTLPVLEKLQVHFFTQLTYSIPHLQQFITTAENLLPNTITLAFNTHWVEVTTNPHEGARMYTLTVSFGGRGLDRQVASAAQVCRTLRTVFSFILVCGASHHQKQRDPKIIAYHCSRPYTVA